MKTKKSAVSSKTLIKSIVLLALSGVCFCGGVALAKAGTVTDLSGLATNITSSFGAVARLITAGAYIAGFGFAVAAILKFKAHKDNPTQVPVGTPIALLFIAIALIFMPSLFEVGGKTVFGSSATAGKISGVDTISGIK